MGKLRGVVLTPRLRSVIDEILSLPQQRRGQKEEQQERLLHSSTVDHAAEEDIDIDGDGGGGDGSAESRSTSSLHVPSNADDARSAAMAAMIVSDGGKSSSGCDALSLSGLAPLRCLVDYSIETSANDRDRLRRELEDALRVAGLSFESRTNDHAGGGGSTSPNNSNAAFARRLERLRLMDEERSYGRLTTNLRSSHSSTRDDDVTARSMTYAASVGLNMIVAPISFGVFMYFFAGGIFGRFLDDVPDADVVDDVPRRGGGGNAVDVRRVIAGVVSGVFMLFVEMVLYVIRSHEIEASVARKGRRRENRANPFGYTQKSMARVYVRED